MGIALGSESIREALERELAAESGHEVKGHTGGARAVVLAVQHLALLNGSQTLAFSKVASTSEPQF